MILLALSLTSCQKSSGEADPPDLRQPPEETGDSADSAESEDTSPAQGVDSVVGGDSRASTDSRGDSHNQQDSSSGRDSDAPPVWEGFSYVSGGRYELGCTREPEGEESCDGDEYPVHVVELTRDFWVAQTETTQEQYERLMGENPSGFQDCGPQCPVEQVSWHMAAAYTNALSDSEGLGACYSCEGEGKELRCQPPESPYDCEGYRLGTEAEWEIAARCGEDWIYAGSDNPEEIAWTAENSSGVTHPVAAKAPNACALYDMSGNVWEWVHDGYGLYEEEELLDPVGDPKASRKIYRSCSWNYPVQFARVSDRNQADPEGVDYRTGFRVFRSAR